MDSMSIQIGQFRELSSGIAYFIPMNRVYSQSSPIASIGDESSIASIGESIEMLFRWPIYFLLCNFYRLNQNNKNRINFRVSIRQLELIRNK